MIGNLQEEQGVVSKIFEPEIDDDYLDSYLEVSKTVGPAMKDLLKADEDYSEDPLVVIPRPLTDSDLALRIYKCTNREDKEADRLRVSIDIVGVEDVHNKVEDRGFHDSRIDFRIEDDPDTDTIMVYGYINNPISLRLKRGLPVTTNFSGLIAPYEDLLCQTVAEISQKSVIRSDVTSQAEQSRFVQNYVRRNYGLEIRDSSIVGGAPDIVFTKTFGI